MTVMYKTNEWQIALVTYINADHIDKSKNNHDTIQRGERKKVRTQLYASITFLFLFDLRDVPLMTVVSGINYHLRTGRTLWEIQATVILKMGDILGLLLIPTNETNHARKCHTILLCCLWGILTKKHRRKKIRTQSNCLRWHMARGWVHIMNFIDFSPRYQEHNLTARHLFVFISSWWRQRSHIVETWKGYFPRRPR